MVSDQKGLLKHPPDFTFDYLPFLRFGAAWLNALPAAVFDARSWLLVRSTFDDALAALEPVRL
jgi:hypothetical protein